MFQSTNVFASAAHAVRKCPHVSERGQATSEYGIVVVIAIALGMAVLSLFTTGRFDDILHGLVQRALEFAKDRIG